MPRKTLLFCAGLKMAGAYASIKRVLLLPAGAGGDFLRPAPERGEDLFRTVDFLLLDDGAGLAL
jgi:hypothetical protein